MTGKIGGLQINYRIQGEGTPLLILHGWGGSLESWKPVQEILSAGYKVVCPDLPGFGKSEAPLEPWDVSDYEKWTLEFLNYLKIRKCHLLAHSFGGRVAVKLSADRPGKISKLILCSPAGVMDSGLKKKTIELAVCAGKRIPLGFFKKTARKILHFLLRKKDYVKAQGVMRETFKKVVEEDLSGYLDRIKSKTLIVWGRKDKMVPVKQAYFFHERIENSELEILKKRGHSPHLEEPEELVNLLLKFLKI